jgi:hypothetical protein
MRYKLLLVLLSLLLLVPFSAYAQQESGTHSRTITGAMIVHCDSLTGQALDYARKVGICPKTPVSSSGAGVTPYGSGSNVGNCGTVKLTINNWSGGNANFVVEVWSSIGPMTAVSYSVPWTNLRTSYGNTVVGGTPIGVGTYYSDSRLVFTGAGLVSGVLSGWAQVNLVLRCYFVPTAASETIT